MISFLHPGFLYAALAIAAGIVALHFIVTEQPRTGILPTVRFFPDLPARASTLTLRFSDKLLMLLRVLTVLLLGAAFAQPRFQAGHRTVANIVAIDVSSATGNMAEVADSALPYIENAAAIVLFDSSAREIPVADVRDSLARYRQDTHRRAPSTISPALIASLRAGSRVRSRADSIGIVIISPFTSAQVDAATIPLRAHWPGNIRTVRVSQDTSTKTATRAAQVTWADSGASPHWVRREKADTVGAIAFGRDVLVHAFARRWKLASGDSARVIARWMDGEPAAVEQNCVRSYAFSLPTTGDAPIRADFVRFVETAHQPCGATAVPGPLGPETVSALQGPKALAASGAIAPQTVRMTSPVPWLLTAALLLALLELYVRSRRGVSRVATQSNAEPVASATPPRAAA